MKRGRRLDLDRAISERVSKHPDGCWLWTGTINHKGYGAISVNGRTTAAHRAVYERTVGVIPHGLVLDHLCRVRHCVNPTHLEPVTTAENNRRSAPFNPAYGRFTVRSNGGGGRPVRTECQRGHQFSPDNILMHKDGKRRCKTCERAREKARIPRERAARPTKSAAA